ncbi:MAG: hypothetical protein BGO36_04115 [Burkholderiales bacterium 68-10]|nr:MAG: hypothetical protein BGO36_04115 [Burkholderiales bacterium 68-10]
MARRPLVSIIAIGALLALSAGAWWWQRGGGATGAGPQPAASAPRGAGGPGAGKGPGAGGGAPPPVVELAPARAMTLRDAASAVGSLRSRQSVVLRPEVAGRVTLLNFRDGERVRRGQLLVQLDDRLALAQVQQARAELGIAESNHRRNADLAGQGFISARAVDESQAAVAVARAKLELAQATAARLKILAPFGGLAGIGNVHVGDVLQAGAEIVHLDDLDAMLLDFRLPERWQTRVRRGQVSHVTLDALPGHAFEAVIQAIDPQIDAQGRSVAVRACIDNREGLLRPGMFARVDTAFGERPGAVMLPEEAVLSQGGNLYVYRLAAAPAQGGPGPEGTAEVSRVEVTLGARLGGRGACAWPPPPPPLPASQPPRPVRQPPRPVRRPVPPAPARPPRPCAGTAPARAATPAPWPRAGRGPGDVRAAAIHFKNHSCWRRLRKRQRLFSS